MKIVKQVKPLDEKEQRKQQRKNRDKSKKVSNEELLEAIVDFADEIQEIKQLLRQKV